MSPCLSCGACCAAFRVSFYRGEVLDEELAVPEDLVEEVTPFRVAMRGTRFVPPRCVALEGAVGGATRCTIYENRPSPCRELQPAWLDGQPSEGCDRARVMHGLAPLTPADWMLPAVAAAVAAGEEAPREHRLRLRERERRARPLLPPRRRRLRRGRR